MIISNEQSEYLIQLKKKVLQNDVALEQLTINQEFPMHLRFELISVEDDDFSFLWEITQSAKNTIRISLHFQEDESKIGLFRVDYNSGHRKPEIASDTLPQRFLPFVGKWFSNEESHVHYHVEGYKPLAWAIPREDSEMTTKEIAEMNTNENLSSAIQEFAKIINLETVLTINTLLL